MNIDVIDELCDKISNLRYTIENTHLTDADSNVLSVALQKIEKDRAEMNCTIDAMYQNQYEDMIDYYDNKIDNLYKRLHRNYYVVYDLYLIAADRERESLLSYLEKR